MKLRVIITGSTGMVGEGVTLECLAHDEVEHVLVINRRPLPAPRLRQAGLKLTEIIHADFTDLAPISGKLTNYNACFFCAGVTSVGKKEDEYRKLTYDLTLSFAKTISSLNKDMTFCYVSGAGTDSSERGRMMWARVKGKTENDLFRLPFKRAFAFRPVLMKPVKGQKNVPAWGRAALWLYPLIRLTAPRYACTLKEVAQAMINAASRGYGKGALEVRDIVDLSNLSDSSNSSRLR
ncbi:MAG: NAD-dependent epimerase/dehydratase family protein [Thermodesulfobacteriota bacterium]